jgi:hypothetical protein
MPAIDPRKEDTEDFGLLTTDLFPGPSSNLAPGNYSRR